MSTPKQHCRCPEDAGVIPLVDEFRNWPSPLVVVRFFWCHWCNELFAFGGDNGPGSRLAASFAYDKGKATFVLWEAFGNADDIKLVEEAMLKMTFVPRGSNFRM